MNCSFEFLRQTDYEYIIILITLVVLFAFSLKKREISSPKPGLLDLFVLSKEMSIVLKGIACIFILLGHYSRYELGGGLPKSVSYYVTAYTAPVALTIFMFCSGFGVSLKSDNQFLWNSYLRRIVSVYLPLVFVCIITAVCGFARPVGPIWQYCIGWLDEWYVWCIIYFYSIYYLSVYVADKMHQNETLVLTIGLLMYTFFSYFYHGYYQAHFFRYPCAFMIGHLIARRNEISIKSLFSVLLIFIFTIALDEFHYYKCYFIAFVLIGLVGLVEKCFIIKKGPLFFMGEISFFFYLCHERLGYSLIESFSFRSCILWIMITIIIAYTIQRLYKYVSNLLYLLLGTKS